VRELIASTFHIILILRTINDAASAAEITCVDGDEDRL
jgi:hypothetical protein